MSENLFVDASAPFVFSDDAPLAFFKSTRDDTWFYAARAARIATREGRYQLQVVRMRENPDGAGLTTTGGALHAQLNLAPIAARPEDEQAWTDAIRNNSPFVPAGVERLTLLPLGLRDGKMTIDLPPGVAADPAALQDMPIGTQATVPVDIALTPTGTDLMWAGLKAGTGLPVTVRVTGTYSVLWPSAHYRITANTSKVYDFFEVNVKARASYFGLVGAQADIDVVRKELVGSGAVSIEWLAKPEGFDESKVAHLQNSIIDSFARSALNLMVADASDAVVAPNPEGFFGGVSVALKSKHVVESLNLSGEYKENDLRIETFGYAFTFAQLPDLGPSYGIGVDEPNRLPITLNLGADPVNIEQYACQYGYRRADGSVVGGKASTSGGEGLLLTGVLEWPIDEPRPDSVEVQFLTDWANIEWEDHVSRTDVTELDAGALFGFTPGNFVKQIAINCDFARAPVGSVASLEWRTVFPPDPDGFQPKNFSGGLIYEGTGDPRTADLEVLRFPYTKLTEAKALFEWEATLITPDGTIYTGTFSEPLSKASAILAYRARLKPSHDDVVPRSLRPLVDTGRPTD